MPKIELRPATADDAALVFVISEAAMRGYVEQTWGRWVADEQQERHRNSYHPEHHQIVLADGAPAGVLAVEEHGTHLQLAKLYLLARWRNQGVGTRLLQGVLARARAAGKPLRLRVLAVNVSAQRFYARHGFTTTGRTPERRFMQAGHLPVLETTRLQLRLVTAADLPALLQVNGDETVTRFLPYAPWRSAADAQAWYQRMLGLHAEGTALQFVLLRRDSGLAIGTALLFRFDEGSARAELGYVLGREHWGQGLMAEALAALIGWAFGGLKLRRLEAEVNPDNLASVRLLQQLGFTQEGRLRQRWVGHGQAYDVLAFGLLRDEWPRGGAAAAAAPP